ncbi:hypothetical protein EG834_03330, partial [bacterium]|nr:hypothetical protein [bacterium]
MPNSLGSPNLLIPPRISCGKRPPLPKPKKHLIEGYTYYVNKELARRNQWTSRGGWMPKISDEGGEVVILISANAEWTAVMQYFHLPPVETSPFGSFFQLQLGNREAVLFHGGWGKIAAAASAQYVIDRWQPGLVINLGTCGGLEDKTRVGEILLVEKTLVYDIYERMGDPAQAIDHYTTSIDLSFLNEPYPQVVRRSLLVSADQDID